MALVIHGINQQAKWPHLTTMCMPRKMKVDTQTIALRNIIWLMIKHNPKQRAINLVYKLLKGHSTTICAVVTPNDCQSLDGCCNTISK